jgi:hypothetical protein
MEKVAQGYRQGTSIDRLAVDLLHAAIPMTAHFGTGQGRRDILTSTLATLVLGRLFSAVTTKLGTLGSSSSNGRQHILARGLVQVTTLLLRHASPVRD